MAIQNSKGQLTYQLDIDKQQVNGFPIPCDFYSTGKIGVIYPTQALEVNYGNKIENNSSAAVQFNPLAVPIMANMYEKQEHYYTPYIDVWDNFDNFISGGEDGTFNTPPPTFTFYQLMSKLVSLLGLSYDYSRYEFLNNTTSSFNGIYQLTNGVSVFMTIPSVGSMESRFSSKSYGFFAGNGLVDIYREFIVSSFNKIIDSINNLRTEALTVMQSMHITSNGTYLSSDGRFLFTVNGSSVSTQVLFMASKDLQIVNNSVSPYQFTRLFDVKEENTYYKTLGTTITTYEQNLGIFSDQSASNLLFTDFGNSYFINYYGMFKPFCGVGSYVDCLNLGRFTDTDFYLMFIVGYYNALLNQDDWNLSEDVCSEMPKSALVLRVQYLIWYNNYRDQLLETQALKPRRTDDITDEELLILTIPRVRCWQKDSYTTALDNPATADAVVPTNNPLHQEVTSSYRAFVSGQGADELSRNDGTITSIKFADGETLHIPNGLLSGFLEKDNKEGDLTSSTTHYISLHMLDAVRRAQSFMRKALFYGNRIQDFIYTTYGVAYLDSRLRLPEILSASTSVVELNTLVNNTTTSESVAGDRAGYAKGWDEGNKFIRYCEEAGVIMSFFTIMPEQTYAYGSDRKYSRLDRFDFPIPDFATLGMDAIFDFELTDTSVKVHVLGETVSEYPLIFGYQGRYYDSKYRQSTEHGELLTTQDMYTFARKWNMYSPGSRPKLNYEFVHCWPALDMFVMEDGTEDYFRFNVHHDTLAHLALPYHSIYMS